jgi:hypothetical protein
MSKGVPGIQYIRAGIDIKKYTDFYIGILGL